MPNRLLDITVRANWPEIERDWASRAAATWRWAQAAIIVALLAVLLMVAVAPRWPGLTAARLALLALVTWGPVLWYLMGQGQVQALRQARGVEGLGERDAWSGISLRARFALALAVLAAANVIAVAAAPSGIAERWTLSAGAMASPAMPRLPLPLALVAPVAAWGLLLSARRGGPAAFRSLGFVGGDWFYYTVAGAAAGTALGFHLLLTARGLPVTADSVSASGLAWLLCCGAGLRAAGEELLLRGLGYHLLSREARPLTAIMARLAATNILLTLLSLVGTVAPALQLLLAIYTAFLAVITTFLRYRSGSLAPALACNAVFTLFAGAVLPW